MNRAVYYVAHPVAGDVAQNARRARQWLAWLMDGEPEVAFVAPWLPYVDAFIERFGGIDDQGSIFRARCMLDNRTLIARCDGIVLCGGRVSDGMKLELAALQLHAAVIDLTHLGAEPPTSPSLRLPERYRRPLHA